MGQAYGGGREAGFRVACTRIDVCRSSYRRSCPTGTAVIDKCGQATKGAGWMSWHREATKDVVACDKPREAGKRALIRGFLNEETQLRNPQLPAGECIAGVERTQGTETSKYLEEKKETSIPSVAASERGR